MAEDDNDTGAPDDEHTGAEGDEGDENAFYEEDVTRDDEEFFEPAFCGAEGSIALKRGFYASSSKNLIALCAANNTQPIRLLAVAPSYGLVIAASGNDNNAVVYRTEDLEMAMDPVVREIVTQKTPIEQLDAVQFPRPFMLLLNPYPEPFSEVIVAEATVICVTATSRKALRFSLESARSGESEGDPMVCSHDDCDIPFPVHLVDMCEQDTFFYSLKDQSTLHVWSFESDDTIELDIAITALATCKNDAGLCAVAGVSGAVPSLLVVEVSEDPPNVSPIVDTDNISGNIVSLNWPQNEILIAAFVGNFIVVYELPADAQDVLTSGAVRAWRINDPCNNPRPTPAWEPTWYCDYFEPWEAFVVATNHSPSVAVVGRWEEETESGWYAWSITYSTDAEYTSRLEVAEKAHFGFADRPLVPLADQSGFDNRAYIVGAVWMTSATRPVDPLSVLGNVQELEGVKPFPAPPTLLVASSTGLVHTLAIVDKDPTKDYLVDMRPIDQLEFNIDGAEARAPTPLRDPVGSVTRSTQTVEASSGASLSFSATPASMSVSFQPLPSSNPNWGTPNANTPLGVGISTTASSTFAGSNLFRAVPQSAFGNPIGGPPSATSGVLFGPSSSRPQFESSPSGAPPVTPGATRGSESPKSFDGPVQASQEDARPEGSLPTTQLLSRLISERKRLVEARAAFAKGEQDFVAQMQSKIELDRILRARGGQTDETKPEESKPWRRSLDDPEPDPKLSEALLRRASTTVLGKELLASMQECNQKFTAFDEGLKNKFKDDAVLAQWAKGEGIKSLLEECKNQETVVEMERSNQVLLWSLLNEMEDRALGLRLLVETTKQEDNGSNSADEAFEHVDAGMFTRLNRLINRCQTLERKIDYCVNGSTPYRSPVESPAESPVEDETRDVQAISQHADTMLIRAKQCQGRLRRLQRRIEIVTKGEIDFSKVDSRGTIQTITPRLHVQAVSEARDPRTEIRKHDKVIGFDSFDECGGISDVALDSIVGLFPERLKTDLEQLRKQDQPNFVQEVDGVLKKHDEELAKLQEKTKLVFNIHTPAPGPMPRRSAPRSGFSVRPGSSRLADPPVFPGFPPPTPSGDATEAVQQPQQQSAEGGEEETHPAKHRLTVAPTPTPPPPFATRPGETAIAFGGVLGSAAAASSAFGGGGSSPFGAPSTGRAGGPASHESQLRRFYDQVDKTKLTEVEKIIKKYQGTEAKLWQNLKTKYPTHAAFIDSLLTEMSSSSAGQSKGVFGGASGGGGFAGLTAGGGTGGSFASPAAGGGFGGFGGATITPSGGGFSSFASPAAPVGGGGGFGATASNTSPAGGGGGFSGFAAAAAPGGMGGGGFATQGGGGGGGFGALVAGAGSAFGSNSWARPSGGGGGFATTSSPSVTAPGSGFAAMGGGAAGSGGGFGGLAQQQGAGAGAFGAPAGANPNFTRMRG